MPRLASGGRRGGAARAVDALAPCVTGRDFLRCAHVAPPGQEHSELSQDGAESTGADEERGAYRHVEDCDGLGETDIDEPRPDKPEREEQAARPHQGPRRVALFHRNLRGDELENVRTLGAASAPRGPVLPRPTPRGTCVPGDGRGGRSPTGATRPGTVHARGRRCPRPGGSRRRDPTLPPPPSPPIPP